MARSSVEEILSVVHVHDRKSAPIVVARRQVHHDVAPIAELGTHDAAKATKSASGTGLTAKKSPDVGRQPNHRRIMTCPARESTLEREGFSARRVRTRTA